MHHAFGWALGWVIAVAAATGALACGVCTDLPERTASERLISDDVLVLARPDPASPFRYAIIEVLRGDPAGLAPPPFLIPSTERRRMARDTTYAAVLSYGPQPGPKAEAAPPRANRYGGVAGPVNQTKGWSRVLSGSGARLDAVRDIVTRARGWGVPRPTSGLAPRFAHFAALEGSADPALRLIALHELSLWPYAQLRRMTPATPAAKLRAETMDRNRIAEAPLLIQLLGLSRSPEAAALVRRGAENAFRVGGSERRAAWGIALVEQTGRTGLDTFIARVALAPARDSAARREALLALAAIAEARPALRAPALQAVADVAAAEPDLLAQATGILAQWQDWQLIARAQAQLSAPGLAPDTAYRLRYYVAQSRARAD
ncbi:MAG: hypothetical protein AAGG09_19020 [Pseudomonadota bacterium]